MTGSIDLNKGRFQRSPQRFPGSGLVKAITLPWRIRRLQRRYLGQISSLARHRLESEVVGILEGRQVQEMGSLMAGLAMDFPQDVQPAVKERGSHLDAIIAEEVQIAVATVSDEITLRSARVDDLRTKLLAKRNLRQSLDDEPKYTELSPNTRSLEHRFKLESRTKHLLSNLKRLKIRTSVLFALALGVIALEGALVYMSLQPAFFGVAGVASWLLPAQALLITAVMVYLAHQIRSENGVAGRWLACISLCVIALALSLLRVGVLLYKSGDILAETGTLSPESFGIATMLFLGGMWLALLGGEAFRRGNDTLSCMEDLRSELSGSLAQEDSKLAAQDTEEANQRRFRQRQCESTLNRLTSITGAINRAEHQLRGEHAEIRGLVAAAIRSAHERLEHEIRSSANQLGRWYCRPSSCVSIKTPAVARLMALPALLLGVSLLTTSCAPFTSANEQLSARHVLVDTSASLTQETFQRIKGHVLRDLGDWVASAHSGEQFTIWWLSPQGTAYPAERETITMPQLQVPAHLHRKRLAAHMVQRTEQIFDQLPYGVKRTRLLEATYLISSTQDHAWSLVVYSDLQQDSQRWDELCRRIKDGDDEDLVQNMLVLCPAVTVPPARVSLVSWPGLVSHDHGGVQEHTHDRALFTDFFATWAPEANILISSIS